MSEPEVLPPAADRADPADPRLGTIVSPYTITRLLGRGGMGAVYEARHMRLGRRVAIKFLLPELAARPEILRRFENEAVAAGGLEHPNLVAVTDLGRGDDGAPYLVMEFLEGEDCARLLERGGVLPAPRAAEIVLQACRGVAAAHAGRIIHRDLKPENLFVTDAGDGSDLVKVLDFGVAKLRPSDGRIGTRTGATLGTTHYMSPEQARGAGEVDPRTDVWSLGVVLYELLGGRKPFDGEDFLNIVHQILSLEATPLGELRAGLPPGLVAVVARAMSKDVGERFQSVAALAEALHPFASRAPARPMASPTAVTIESDAARSAPAGRRAPSRRLGTIFAITLLAMGTSLVYGVRRASTKRSEPAPSAALPVVPASLPAPPAPVAPRPSPAPPVVVEPSPPRSAEATPAPHKRGPAAPRAGGVVQGAQARNPSHPEATRERALTLEPNPY